MALDLWTANRNFDCDVLAKFIAMSDLRGDRLVVNEQDVGIGHLVYLRTNPQVTGCRPSVAELDDCILTITRDPHLIKPSDARSLSWHITFSVGDPIRLFTADHTTANTEGQCAIGKPDNVASEA
jgi:hypothetical protein